MFLHRYLPLIVFGALLGGQIEAGEVARPPEEPAEGAFSRLVGEGRFVGPGVLTVEGDAQSKPVAAEDVNFLAADFQPVSTLALVADRLAAEFPDALAQIVAALPRQLKIVGLVTDDRGRDAVLKLLAARELPGDRLQFLQLRTDSIWIRDFGPVVVGGDRGPPLALDFRYLRRSGNRVRKRDDDAAAAIARYLGIPVRRQAIELEGGNLLSNGRGLLVTTTAAFNANINRGRTANEIVQTLGQCLGCRQVVMLEPLYGEPTGHVDVFACFVDSQTVLLGSYQQEVDPINSLVLDRNADLLAKARTATGRLRVIRIQMPDNEDERWRSYTNSVFAGGVLLVPRYGGRHAAGDKRAAATFKRLLPKWRIVGIDCHRLARDDGALRCITLCVPQVRR